MVTILSASYYPSQSSNRLNDKARNSHLEPVSCQRLKTGSGSQFHGNRHETGFGSQFQTVSVSLSTVLIGILLWYAHGLSGSKGQKQVALK